MGLNKSLFSICLGVFCVLAFANTSNLAASDSTDIARLRKDLQEVAAKDFEITKDYVSKRAAARGGETFWLAHLKPKKSGHYSLKYSFRYTHQREYPEEGENELFIRVGEHGCFRNLSGSFGMGNICLGDTIIVPVRIDNRAEHKFSLKSSYSDSKSIGKDSQYKGFRSDELSAEGVGNPLAENLKYLGTVRSVMPHRNAGAETVVLTAYFEVKKNGRFNLGVSATRQGGNSNADELSGVSNSLPIIITEKGTPLTGLVFKENTINYGNKRRFSGHAGNNFLTKILLLQPGDIFPWNMQVGQIAVNYGKRQKRRLGKQ